jgi:hypothetical protein
MEIDAKKLDEIKKQLETITGEKIEASPEQLIQLFFRVSLSSFEDGVVMSRLIIQPGKFCTGTSAFQPAATLLDVNSRSVTGADGKVVFLLTQFICGTVNSFSEPVSLVVTPNAATPCYATMTHKLIPTPGAPGSFNDLQVTVFTWGANGAPTPNVGFDWRCRLLSLGIIT